MSPLPKPRVLGLVDATAPVRLGDFRADPTDTDIADLLAIWLAEVSAEASLRTPAGEAESHTAEPTD